MTTLDALIKNGPRKSGRGCRFPGCSDHTRATVSIMLRRFAEGKHTASSFDGSVSRQVSLCEKHAVEVWSKIIDVVPQ